MQQRMDRRKLLTATLMPAALAGCSVPGFRAETGGDEDTIELWYWNRSIDESLFRAFEEQNPGITVNDVKVGGDYASRVNTTLAGKAFVPDVMAFNDDIARYFPSEDQFEDLYDYGAAEVEDLYLPWKWELGVTPDGRMIGFPMDTGPIALYYRADMYEQAGLPSEPEDVTATFAEWDTWLEAGTQLQEALPGVRMTDNIPNLYLHALKQSDVFYVNADDVYVGSDDHVRRAWDMAMKAFDLQLAANVNAFTADWSAAMSNDAVASFVGASWMKQVLLESGDTTSGTWRVAQAPGGPGNNGGSFIGVTRYARNKELAFELIKFVQSPENQLVNYTSLSLFPAAVDALEHSAMSEEEEFFGGQATSLEFVASADNLAPFYSSPAYPIVHGIINGGVTDVAVGGASQEDAWESAQEQVEREVHHKAPWVKWEEA